MGDVLLPDDVRRRGEMLEAFGGERRDLGEGLPRDQGRGKLARNSDGDFDGLRFKPRLDAADVSLVIDQDADLDLLSASHASPGVDGGGHVIGDADAGFGEGDSTSGFIGSVHISSTSLDASDQPLGHVDEAFGGSLLDGFDYGYSGDSEQSAAGVDRWGPWFPT